MTADLARLAAVLEGELRSGCRDTLVEGGLDELLRRQARDDFRPVMRHARARRLAGHALAPFDIRRGEPRRVSPGRRGGRPYGRHPRARPTPPRH